MKVRNDRPHHAYGISPNELLAQMLEDTGERSHKFQAFDANIMLATCLSPKRAKHKFSRTHGVWCNFQWYRCKAMDVLKHGAKVPIKLEPWIDDVIYVQIDGMWHAAVCRDSRAPFRHTSKEVAIARRTERRVANLAWRQVLLSGPHLFNKARYEYPAYFDPRLHEQQSEMRHLYSGVSMGVALPEQVWKLAREFDDRPAALQTAPPPRLINEPARRPELVSTSSDEPQGARFMVGLARIRKG